MRVILSKWGNSLAFRLPKDIAELAGFQKGQALELTLDGQSIVIRRPVPSLDEMIKDMEGKEWHPLDFDDAPRGSEIW